MISLSKYKLFDDIIDMVINDKSTLRKCEIRWCGDRYDLIFYIKSTYNNPLLLYSAIIETCNEMFTWIDISNEVSIVIVGPKNTKHFTYFELIYKTLHGDRHIINGSQSLLERYVPRDKREHFLRWRDHKIYENNIRKRDKILRDMKKKTT